MQGCMGLTVEWGAEHFTSRELSKLTSQGSLGRDGQWKVISGNMINIKQGWNVERKGGMIQVKAEKGKS